jgi:hypothetical protein
MDMLLCGEVFNVQALWDCQRSGMRALQSCGFVFVRQGNPLFAPRYEAAQASTKLIIASSS